MYGTVDLWISPLLISISSHFLMTINSGWENCLFFCDRGSLLDMISIVWSYGRYGGRISVFFR